MVQNNFTENGLENHLAFQPLFSYFITLANNNTVSG